MTFRPIKEGDHLVLLDASGYVYRAFHALPPLSRASDNHPTGAISGYCAMLWALIAGEAAFPAPTHLVAAFDAGGKTARHALYPAYKANRPPVAPELAAQFIPCRKATDALGIARVESHGTEADDIIATYARRAAGLGALVTIVSSDKDLRQLIGERIVMFDPIKRVPVDAASVKARMGVAPCHVADYLALVGDTADNVPGVPGIGEKGAAALITAHGDVAGILAAAVDGTIAEKHRARLLQHRESLLLSRRLVALDEQVAGLPSLASFACGAPQTERFIAFLREYELATLTARVERRA